MKNIYSILLAFMTISLYGQVEIEPNNNFSFANQIVLSTNWEGKINIPSDNDYYKFNISEPGILKLVVTSVPSDVYLRGQIYTPDMVEIRKETSNLGQGYQLEVSTCHIGEHFLRFYNASSANNSNEEQYSFRIEFTPFSGLDMCECENESFPQACLINTEETIDALIAPWFDDNPITKDLDYYKFNIPEPGILKLVVTSVPSDVYLRSQIYTPDMNEIRKETSGLGQGYQLEVSTCQIGEHFLRFYNASSANNFNSAEQYSFRIEFTPFSGLDNCECENESFNQACLINTEETIDALIAPWFDDNPITKDLDYYKFNIPEPGILKLVVTSVPGDVYLRSEIYTPDMNEIRKETSGLGQGYQLEVSTCQIGEHFLRFYNASSANNFNSEDQYSFRIEFTPFSGLDNCECENESFNQACLINTEETIDALIAPWFDDNQITKDLDYYKFNIPEPGILKLVVTSVPSDVYLRSEIYTPEMIEIRKETSGLGQGYQMEVSTCDIGEHFLRFYNASSVNNFSSEEQYSFRIEFTPFSEIDMCECNNSINNACPINVCESTLAVIAPWFDDNNIVYDKDFYQIELSVNEEVSVEVSQVPLDMRICVTIYDELNSQIDNYNGNIGEAINFDFTVPEDGIYYFELSGCDGNFNSESQYELKIGCNLINNTQELDLYEIVNISPNPFIESLNIEFKSLIEKDNDIMLYDAVGNLVFSQKNIEMNNLYINTDTLPEGIYVLRLRIGNTYYSEKLIKVR